MRCGRTVAPITSLIPRDVLIEAAPKTVAFENFPELRVVIISGISAAIGYAVSVVGRGLRAGK